MLLGMVHRMTRNAARNGAPHDKKCCQEWCTAWLEMPELSTLRLISRGNLFAGRKWSSPRDPRYFRWRSALRPPQQSEQLSDGGSGDYFNRRNYDWEGSEGLHRIENVAASGKMTSCDLGRGRCSQSCRCAADKSEKCSGAIGKLPDLRLNHRRTGISRPWSGCGRVERKTYHHANSGRWNSSKGRHSNRPLGFARQRRNNCNLSTVLDFSKAFSDLQLSKNEPQRPWLKVKVFQTKFHRKHWVVRSDKTTDSIIKFHSASSSLLFLR
ncbi:hypothetical protein J6590_036138 [Homalodisca vitripennis]|nr:hypothetical protein J6590_036138 [Homalodisca vitripennis]